MKKPQLHILMAVTLLFAAFTLGFFLGRNTNRTSVQVSVLPEVTAPRTAAREDTQTDSTEVSAYPIDLNTATKAQLMTLPGIGDVYAQQILDYREAHGGFEKVEDLLNIAGIGSKRLEDIIDLVTIGG